MTDERIAEFDGIFIDSEGYGRELVEALKAERELVNGEYVLHSAAVRALPDKWRKDADYLSGAPHPLGHFKMRDCADELEKAIKQGK